jgi:hypothetical protein
MGGGRKIGPAKFGINFRENIIDRECDDDSSRTACEEELAGRPAALRGEPASAAWLGASYLIGSMLFPVFASIIQLQLAGKYWTNLDSDVIFRSSSIGNIPISGV